MSVVTPYTPFNSSSGSSQVSASDDAETQKVKNYVKDLLKSRIFLGRYFERRLVDERVGYRDVVLLSAAEVDLKRDLLEAQYKLRSVHPNLHWIGVTDGEPLGYPASVCIWTEIDNQPLGPFWFQIKSIKFRENEIIVMLKCIRHISDAFLEIEPILTGSGKNIKVYTAKADSTTTTAAASEACTEIVETLKSALTITNVKEFVTFLFALIIAIFSGSTAFINFLGNFILALVRELSIFVKNSTPMFLGFLEFLSKIVGGFYILLAMFFRPSNPISQDRRSIAYQQSARRSSRYEYVDERYVDDHRNFD